MESNAGASGNYFYVLVKKCENLIERAQDEGAEVDFHAVRKAMSVGIRYGIPEPFQTAQAHLEERIAATIRRRERGASHKQIVIKIKNVINLFWPFGGF